MEVESEGTLDAEQGLTTSIQDIDGKLSHAQIIDVTELPASDRVVFGTTVNLVDEDNGEKKVYRIVGEDEADIRAGLLSYTSPIARALIGKEVGDIVEVRTPGGDRCYEIAQVQYV